MNERAVLRPSVLIVDERDEVLPAILTALEPLDAPAIAARSADEALRHLREHDVAVILLAVDAAGDDGSTTASMISGPERGRHTPMIVVTTGSSPLDPAEVERAYTAGAADVLTPPLDPPALRAKVRTFLELRRVSSQLRRQVDELSGGADRDRLAVTMLQESMLPPALPQPPGLDVAARYVPADPDAGGDWYDVWWRRDGRVMLVIGDVAGHGLPASATMNEIRIAARAFAMRDPSPRRILQELNAFAEVMGGNVLVTALIALIDPVTGHGTIASAGHLAPLIDTPDGPQRLDLRVAPPLGAGSITPEELEFVLPPSGRLLMFTDGLIERRHSGIDERLAALGEALREHTEDADTLADRCVAAMLPDGRPRDDVALLAVQRSEATHLRAHVAARPANVATLRSTLRRWLEAREVPRDAVDDLVLAAGELIANACIHAYAGAQGEVSLAADDENGIVRLRVADQGTWRLERERGGGRGLSIVRSIADEVEIEAGYSGTAVVITRAVPRAAAGVGGGGRGA